jgi:hypothetical protein
MEGSDPPALQFTFGVSFPGGPSSGNVPASSGQSYPRLNRVSLRIRCRKREMQAQALRLG